jgi:hypothetical protein
MRLMHYVILVQALLQFLKVILIDLIKVHQLELDYKL